MFRRVTRAVAAAAFAIAAVFAVPTAAQAANYGTNSICTINVATTNAGATIVFSCAPGYFPKNITITVTISGEGVSGSSLGQLVAANQSVALGTVTSGADGSISTPVTLSDSARGTVTLTASGGGTTGSASVFVVAPGAAAVGPQTTPLAVTGIDSSQLTTLWIGGGALVLVGGGLATAAAVRRNRKAAQGS